MPSTRHVLVCLLSTTVAAWAAETTGAGLPKHSPFLPSGSMAPALAAANETIEFAGVSSMGTKTDLIFYDKTAKKSHWIREGETKEGITVIGYDARREQAVVKLNGTQKVLPLRKAATLTSPRNPVAGAPPPPQMGIVPPVPQFVPPAPSELGQPLQLQPMPLEQPVALIPPPPTSGAPATPEVQARQETEARMLVSDLLEIGMAQRRAYEEAQRRTGEGSDPAKPPADPNAPGQPGKPNGG